MDVSYEREAKENVAFTKRAFWALCQECLFINAKNNKADCMNREKSFRHRKFVAFSGYSLRTFDNLASKNYSFL